MTRDWRLVTGDSNWWRYDAAARRLSITLHVQPNARRTEIVGLHGGSLKVKITAPAVDNKANVALVDFLSATLGVPKSAVMIRRGAGARHKVVDIAGGLELKERLARLAP